MVRVDLDEAKARLLDLINAVLHGETVIIMKDPQQAVQLVPVAVVPSRQFGSAKGLVVMADDFDAPIPDFDEYLR